MASCVTPEDLYIQAFNAVYRKELNGKVLISADLGQHPRIVERINQWLKLQELVLLRDGGFNHYRVAQALLPKLTRKKLNANELAKFEALFNNLNAALD